MQCCASWLRLVRAWRMLCAWCALVRACGAALPLLRPGAHCLFCSTVPGVYLVLLRTALPALLCRDPELPGTAPILTAYCAGALHAALLYASVTIILYAQTAQCRGVAYNLLDVHNGHIPARHQPSGRG